MAAVDEFIDAEPKRAYLGLVTKDTIMEKKRSQEAAPTDVEIEAAASTPPSHEEDSSLTTFPYSRFMDLMRGEITPEKYAAEVQAHVESQLPIVPPEGAITSRH